MEVPPERGRIFAEKPHQPEVRGSSTFLQFLYAACVFQSIGVATVTPPLVLDGAKTRECDVKYQINVL